MLTVKWPWLRVPHSHRGGEHVPGLSPWEPFTSPIGGGTAASPPAWETGLCGDGGDQQPRFAGLL